MITCVLRYSSLVTLFTKLSLVGIEVKSAVGEGGLPVPIEQRVGRVCTPELIAKNGDRVITIVLSAAEAAKLPDVATPDFLCDWRSDEVDEDGELLPWPQYEVTAPDGWPDTEAYYQGAGKLV